MSKSDLDLLFELAKAFENTTIARDDAVSKFGTERQKAHIKKNNGFKDKSYEKPFLKTLEQLFDNVEPINISRRKYYKVGKALNEIAPREDGRRNNAGQELPHTKYLDALIIMGLKNKIFREHETSMNNWVYNFGLASEAVYRMKVEGLHSPASLELRKDLHQKDLLPSDKQTAELKLYLKDFENIKGQLDNALKKLSNANLIEYYKVPKVRLKKPLITIEEDGRVIKAHTITIDSSTQERISKKQEELREKYFLNHYEIRKQNYHKLTEEKREQADKYFKDLNTFFTEDMYYYDNFNKKVYIEVDFFWFNQAITVKATDRKIEKYLKEKRPEFYKDYIENSDSFFLGAKDNYDQTKRQHVIRQAMMEAEYSLKRTLDNASAQRIKGEKAGALDANEERYKEYWGSEFCKNVERIYPELKTDHKQGIKYLN